MDGQRSLLGMLQQLKGATDRVVRFGSKADICSANRHVRFTPDSGHSTGSCPTTKANVAHRLCNLVHCCRAAIGAMASKPYCQSMLDRPSDEEVSRQILGVFMRHRIPATGTLQRNYFFEVRDSDFQRGINKAVANNWVTIDLRNRYRYQLTTSGYAVGRMIHPVLGA